ncbi:membrane protein [Sulfurifustis variabilis]|uniref:Membrane protein n=1 Tax=Sulfurifustis variabilis TaxID=1675686 RepID=A0A1B4V5V7_9GAMM|nr:phage holin family protein [Sulfurifustis variabilis]BAU47962.1 membrane protein [Sulfurifustis variabilis]
MPGLLLRLLIGAVGLWLAEAVLPGIDVANVGTLIAAAFLLGIVNAVVRPVLVVLTLPITVITLGIFLLVINAAMLGLVALVLPGFHIAGFWSALFGALIVSVTGWFASWFIGPRGRYEVMVVRR